MPARHIALACAVAVAWGVNFVVIDVGLDSFPPLLFAALRFTLIALPAVFFVKKPDIPWKEVVLIGTFLSAGQFGLLFVAMDQGMPAGLASLVLQLQVLFTVALAWMVLGERLSRGQIIGAAVALVGMAVIAGGRAEGVPLIALALCIGAAASWGVGNVITRRAQANDPVSLLVWSSLIPPIPLALLSLGLEGPSEAGDALAGLDISGIAALTYVILVSTVFGFGVWTWLLRRHAAARVVPFALVVPVAGMLSAWVALSETPNTAELTGGAIVLAGLALTMRAVRASQRLDVAHDVAPDPVHVDPEPGRIAADAEVPARA
jgi:O-acetylserine/cysteine efflux transporter